MFAQLFKDRISRQEHEAILKIYKDAMHDEQATVYRLRDENSALVGEIAQLKEERNANAQLAGKLTAELAEFRAKRARQNANLIPGGRRKSA